MQMYSLLRLRKINEQFVYYTLKCFWEISDVYQLRAGKAHTEWMEKKVEAVHL